jgi:hypothetical protein
MYFQYKNEYRIFKLIEITPKRGLSRKTERINQFRLLYIYTWKCQNETPCLAILNKQKISFFSKTKNRSQNRYYLGGKYQSKGGGHKKRV